ncbi:MAG: DUF2779 domain-containing protein [Bacteroidia bacterium]
MSFILSKSTYLYGCQCPKRLYYHKFKSELRNPLDEGQEFIYQQGTDIGVLARDLFPDGIDLSPENAFSYPQAAVKTEKVLDTYYVLYEPTFIANGVMCALDIMVKKQNKWYVYEVKSSTSVKSQHIDDAALQYWVLKQKGLEIADFSIVYVDNTYVKNGPFEVGKFFASQSVLKEIKKQQHQVETAIGSLKKMLLSKVEPIRNIGQHCFSPYECDFTQHCWKDFPQENSVLDLSNGAGWSFFEEGIYAMKDIPSEAHLPPRAQFQLDAFKKNESVINRAAIKEFVQALVYPLSFFDFETYQPAIPEYNGMKPYQRIPFQYSLHQQKNKKSALLHFEFLGDGEQDPREKLIQQMLNDLGKKGSIITYNMSFEKSVILELSRMFPKYENDLLALVDRMKDLMLPFQQRWYYHPDLKGSHSIKTILPHLIPDLSYASLAIQEGGTASLVYGQLKTQSPIIAEQQRKALLAYCKLDTYAMVRILERLRELV